MNQNLKNFIFGDSDFSNLKFSDQTILRISEFDNEFDLIFKIKCALKKIKKKAYFRNLNPSILIISNSSLNIKFIKLVLLNDNKIDFEFENKIRFLSLVDQIKNTKFKPHLDLLIKKLLCYNYIDPNLKSQILENNFDHDYLIEVLNNFDLNQKQNEIETNLIFIKNINKLEGSEEIYPEKFESVFAVIFIDANEIRKSDDLTKVLIDNNLQNIFDAKMIFYFHSEFSKESIFGKKISFFSSFKESLKKNCNFKTQKSNLYLQEDCSNGFQKIKNNSIESNKYISKNNQNINFNDEIPNLVNFIKKPNDLDLYIANPEDFFIKNVLKIRKNESDDYFYELFNAINNQRLKSKEKDFIKSELDSYAIYSNSITTEEQIKISTILYNLLNFDSEYKQYPSKINYQISIKFAGFEFECFYPKIIFACDGVIIFDYQINELPSKKSIKEMKNLNYLIKAACLQIKDNLKVKKIILFRISERFDKQERLIIDLQENFIEELEANILEKFQH